jgi:hypothetical protein
MLQHAIGFVRSANTLITEKGTIGMLFIVVDLCRALFFVEPSHFCRNLVSCIRYFFL